MPRNSSHYPDPLVVEPLSGTHKQSIIVLHGRGSNAQLFAHGTGIAKPGFLTIALPDGRTIQSYFPDAKFVFPTASYQRARMFKRIPITQWFDFHSDSLNENGDAMEDGNAGWQVEGLRETCEFVHGMMRDEIEAVGAGNVVVGGLSQGCASVLVAMLLWKGEPSGGVFGMSGWLPLRGVLMGAVELETDGEDDVFERDRGTAGGADIQDERDVYRKAVRNLCEGLDVDMVQGDAGGKVPVFIAHGGRDAKVPVRRGREAAEFLKLMGCDVRYKEYPDLVHWMSEDELKDIVDFVNFCGMKG